MSDMGYSFLKNVFLEAEDDDETTADAGGATADERNEADTNGDGEVSDDEANAAANEEGDEEDFDVDATIPDDAENAADDGPTDDDTTSDTSTSSSPSEGGDEEVIKANTSIFDSLSAEEQMIKIKKLKEDYRSLYCSIDDILARMNNMDIDEDTLTVCSRVSETLYNLKKFIGDYFQRMFPIKSYIENDIKYNELLSVVKSVTTVVDDLASKKIELHGLIDTTKPDKKS